LFNNTSLDTRYILGRSFLGVGRDLDGQLDGLLKSITGSLVYRFNGLYINACNNEKVLWETEAVAALLAGLVNAEHGCTDYTR